MAEIESKVEDRGAVKRSLKVQVPAERVSAELDRAYARLRSNARVPGFRKGKVPRNVLEARYGRTVREDVVKALIESACAEVLETHGLDIVSAPMLVDQELEEQGALRFEAEVEIRPEIELGTYKGIDYTRSIQRVTEADVDTAVARLRERMAELRTEEDRVNVAGGDVVVFDMYGFSEGKPIEAASGESIQLEVGSGRFPEGFEKQLVGVTRGIRTPIDVNFPEDHSDPELAGKFVRFEVTVREIKNKILPALDDEFVRELDFKGCDTIEELRAKVREDLERHALQDADRRARNVLLEKLVDKHDFDVPDSHVHRQIVSMLHDMGVHSVPEDRAEDLRRALTPPAVKNVKARFLLDAIASAEEIDVTKEELQSEINRELAMARADAERVRSYYSEPGAIAQLHANMRRDKALQKIVELADRKDELVDKSELADDPGSGYSR